MKSLHHISLSLAALLLGSLPARANVIGINPTGSSNATIRFGDGSSFTGPNNGGTYSVLTTPWNGALVTLAPTTDATTLDFANGSISATFAALTYAINVPLSIVTQAIGNTGSAILQYGAVVEFQTDAAGLPSLPTMFPGFNLNGTVQPGGFADFTGSITYTSAFWGAVDTVNYTYTNVTPGPFSATANGVASFGTTPPLPANDTLTLVATFSFTVDPASISATTAPEPTAGLLTLLTLSFFLSRRRAARA